MLLELLLGVEGKLGNLEGRLGMMELLALERYHILVVDKLDKVEAGSDNSYTQQW